MDQVEAPEAKWSIILMYVQFIVFSLAAWYLNQIIPQSFGVPKKWNFLCKRNKRQIGEVGHRLSYDYDEIGDLEEDRENNTQALFDYDI